MCRILYTYLLVRGGGLWGISTGLAGLTCGLTCGLGGLSAPEGLVLYAWLPP